jgi:hypothetical protein
LRGVRRVAQGRSFAAGQGDDFFGVGHAQLVFGWMTLNGEVL